MPEISTEKIKKNAIKQQNANNSEEIKNVYFEYGAYLKILRFSKAGSIDGSRGILLGKKEGDNVYITAALEALYSGDDGLESPSFTKESWKRIMTEKKEYYDSLVIIGQYSTHPKSTPSDEDEAMQKAFLKKDENVLFVFDPLDNTETVNIYSGGGYKKLDGIYIYDKTGEDVNLKMKEAVTRTTDMEYEYRVRALDRFSKRLSKHTSRTSVAMIIIILFVIYVLFQNIELKLSYKNFKNEAESRISSLEETVSQYETKFSEISEAFE